MASLAVDRVRQLSRLSARAGDFVALQGGPDLGSRGASLGPRHELDLPLSSFEVVICTRVSAPDHINVEEAKALLSYVRWILRSGARAGHRIVVLLDSKVAVGAITKGRSSSWPLNQVIRRLAALCFAGGLKLHLIFIPTEHNPGDHPSRGGPGTWPSALKQHKKARQTSARLASHAAAWIGRHRALGLLPPSSSVSSLDLSDLSPSDLDFILGC